MHTNLHTPPSACVRSRSGLGLAQPLTSSRCVFLFACSVACCSLLQLIIGDDPHAGFLKTFGSGALTGMTAASICYPLDLVRSILSVQTNTDNYKGIADAMRSIVKAEGILGLYRGLGPTLMGIAPYIAINMTTFDLLKRRYLPASRDAPYFTLINLGLGASAGFVSAASTYPSDLIRRRMQLQGTKGSHDLPAYRNTWHCITHTVQTEGVKGMYKGLVSRKDKTTQATTQHRTTNQRSDKTSK